MKKILSILLGVIVVFFVVRYFFFKVKDYNSNNSCNSSQFIADGGRIYISFYRNISKTEMINSFDLILVDKEGRSKKINYKKDGNLENKYYTDSKILKSDTLIVKGENVYKFYDFKYDANRIKAGKNRDKYNCSLNYKSVPFNNDNFEDTSENLNTINVYLQ